MPKRDSAPLALFWHRRDLRIADNVGIADLADERRIVPVFCLDPNVLEYAGSPRVTFLLEALRDLRDRYLDRGSDLLVVEGDPEDRIPAVADDYDVDAVAWNADYSGLASERDEAVEAALSEHGTDVRETHDAMLHRPGTIRTNDGEPYSRFSYFWKKWIDADRTPAQPLPDDEVFASIDGTAILSIEDLGFSESDVDSPTASRVAALERLDSFLDEAVYEYEECREIPADACTSRLSQDLKFGLLGIREIIEATKAALEGAETDDERESVREFQRQLAWREFYTQVLAFNPETVTENYLTFENPIEWNRDDDLLQAWKRGEAGYPIVDAGMRQLLETGFIHNRVRMIVASFLTKDLLIDWREGYRWFRERLVDHDTANDVGGWQWAASTGTDSQPYFRVFNPTTQGERYDPDATYITRYVQELRNVDAATIHRWPDLDSEERATVAPGYPDPIVDHATRRKAAIETFQRARGDD